MYNNMSCMYGNIDPWNFVDTSRYIHVDSTIYMYNNMSCMYGNIDPWNFVDTSRYIHVEKIL